MLSHPLLLANLYTGTWRRGRGGIRRSHFVAMAHLKAELWLVHWHQNKHGGRNESNKAFENKCYLLYEINKFRINNSRVRKVIPCLIAGVLKTRYHKTCWFYTRLQFMRFWKTKLSELTWRASTATHPFQEYQESIWTESQPSSYLYKYATIKCVWI